jgi:hypothetical protein
MRKVIQVAAVTPQQSPDVLYALCDDGTVWEREMCRESSGWRQIEPVPQQPKGVTIWASGEGE